MTIKELIEKLKEYDENLEVYLHNYCYDGFPVVGMFLANVRSREEVEELGQVPFTYDAEEITFDGDGKPVLVISDEVD